jgi:hypothetical protein
MVRSIFCYATTTKYFPDTGKTEVFPLRQLAWLFRKQLFIPEGFVIENLNFIYEDVFG